MSQSPESSLPSSLTSVVSSVGLSTPPSSPVLDGQAEQMTTELLAQIRAEWNFEKMIDDIEDHRSRKRLRDHFNNDSAWTIPTIKALEELAKLSPKEEKRNEQLNSLRKALNARCKGYHRKGKKVPTFGKDDAKKDTSVRAEVKILIKKLNPTFEDSEDEQQDEEVEAETTRTNAKLHKTGSTQYGEKSSETGGTHPSSDIGNGVQTEKIGVSQQSGSFALRKPHDKAEHQALRTKISENWLTATLPKHLPDNAHPKSHESEWPYDLLEAIFELSNLTAGEDVEDIRRGLDAVFESTEQYQRKTALKIMRTLLASTDREQGEAQVENSDVGHAHTVVGSARELLVKAGIPAHSK